MTYEQDHGFMTRPLKVPVPLTARQSRLLSKISFRIVRDRPNHPFRSELIGCLGNPGQDRAEVQALLLKLVQDPIELTREYAARSLLGLPPDPNVALQPLLQALSTYPFASGTSGGPTPWRTNVIRVIGSCGPAAKQAVPALINELSQATRNSSGLGFGSDYKRRAATLQALGRIGPDAEAVLWRLHATDEELESYRGDDYDERAAELLISGKCRTEDEARAALFAHPIWRVRRAAVRGSVLERDLLNPRWIPFLLKALNDETIYVRQVAAETLLRNQVERDAAYRSLLRLNETDQSDAWTRVQIMWRYELDPKPVLPQLKAELSESDNPVVKENIGRMIEMVKSGIRPVNGNF